MEDHLPKNKIESLFECTSTYIDTRLELVKLNAIKKLSESIAIISTKVIIAAILFLFLLMLNIGIALWLGNILGKIYYGFFIISIIYFLIGMLVYINKDKWLKVSIINSIIKQLNK